MNKQGKGDGINILLAMIVSGKSRERLIRPFLKKDWSMEETRRGLHKSGSSMGNFQE